MVQVNKRILYTQSILLSFDTEKRQALRPFVEAYIAAEDEREGNLPGTRPKREGSKNYKRLSDIMDENLFTIIDLIEEWEIDLQEEPDQVAEILIQVLGGRISAISEGAMVHQLEEKPILDEDTQAAITPLVKEWADHLAAIAAIQKALREEAENWQDQLPVDQIMRQLAEIAAELAEEKQAAQTDIAA